MNPEETEDPEHRLAARVEAFDEALAAGTRLPKIEPDAEGPDACSALLAAQASLLRLEQVWPRSAPTRAWKPTRASTKQPGHAAVLRPVPDRPRAGSGWVRRRLPGDRPGAGPAGGA